MPRTSLKFPVNFLNRFAPAPVPGPGPVASYQRSDRVRYGERLAAAGECITCHSGKDAGEPVKGKEFAGGRKFTIGQFVARSANITPDMETGIGQWGEVKFLRKFKGYAGFTDENAPKNTQANFKVMPWYGLSKLTDDGLKVLYAYLRTRTPVYNPVVTHPHLAQPQS